MKKLAKKISVFLLTAVMIFGASAIAPPVRVEAADWSSDWSPSGYPKVPYSQLSAEADSEQNGASDGPAAWAVDGSTSTIWHSSYSNSESYSPIVNVTGDGTRSYNTFTIRLSEAQDLAGMTYLPRSDAGNGVIRSLNVYVSTTGEFTGEEELVGSSDGWAQDNIEKELVFDQVYESVTAVKLEILASYPTNNNFISAAEFSLFKPKAEVPETSAYTVRGLDLSSTEATGFYNASEDLSNVSGLTKGTVNLRYRVTEAANRITGLYTVSKDNALNYAAFYVNPGSNTVGVELRGNGGVISTTTYSDGTALSINDTEWHTLTWVFDGTVISLYVDGKAALTRESSVFFGTYSGLNTMTVGGRVTSNGTSLPKDSWHYPCMVDEISVYEETFSADQVMQLHAATSAETGNPLVKSVTAQSDGDSLTVNVTFNEPMMAIGTPKLRVTVGEDNTPYEVAYVSGSATDTLTFTGSAPKGITVDRDTIVDALDTVSGLVESVDGADFDFTRIPHYRMTAEASEQHTNQPASNAIDDDPATQWHTPWNTDSLPAWLDIEFPQEYVISSYTYQPRSSGSNGNVREYSLLVSIDGLTWYTVAEDSSWENNNKSKTITFDPVSAKYVRFYVTGSYGDGPDWYACAAEINISRTAEPVKAANYDDLKAAYTAAQTIPESRRSEALKEAMAKAQELITAGNADVPQYHINKIAEHINSEIESLSLYTVTYIMGEKTEYIRAKYNDSITIVLDKSQIPDGQEFAGWYLNDEENVIVSQDMKYTLYVVGNMKITAKFVPAGTQGELESAASISNVNITKCEGGKFDAQFIGHLTVPEGYTLNATGLLWSPDTISADVLNTTDGPQIGENAKIKQVDVSKVSSAYQFSVTVKSVPEGKTVHAVSFAKMTNNATGKAKWVYSSEATATAE